MDKITQTKAFIFTQLSYLNLEAEKIEVTIWATVEVKIWFKRNNLKIDSSKYIFTTVFYRLLEFLLFCREFYISFFDEEFKVFHAQTSVFMELFASIAMFLIYFVLIFSELQVLQPVKI